jgi:hypothetical protein
MKRLPILFALIATPALAQAPVQGAQGPGAQPTPQQLSKPMTLQLGEILSYGTYRAAIQKTQDDALEANEKILPVIDKLNAQLKDATAAAPSIPSPALKDAPSGKPPVPKIIQHPPARAIGKSK